MKRFTLMSVFAALLSACSVTGPETLEIRLEPYLVPCMSWFPTTCMVGKKVGSDTYTLILEGYERRIRIPDGEDLARLRAVGTGEHPTLLVRPAVGEEWLEGHSVTRP